MPLGTLRHRAISHHRIDGTSWWVYGVALGYNFIIRDLVAWVMSVWVSNTPAPPPLEMAALMTVLMGLLGLGRRLPLNGGHNCTPFHRLGGLRTVEKLSGRAK